MAKVKISPNQMALPFEKAQQILRDTSEAVAQAVGQTVKTMGSNRKEILLLLGMQTFLYFVQKYIDKKI